MAESFISAELRLAQSGYTLPTLPVAGGNYVAARQIGLVLYLAGAISSDAGGVMSGTVGLDRTMDEGYSAARQCALAQLAVIRHEAGSLDAVEAIVSVNGYVNAVPGFADSPKVLNGASDLLVAIFGEAGRHVRAAVGVASLPRNAMVEVQMIVLLRERPHG